MQAVAGTATAVFSARTTCSPQAQMSRYKLAHLFAANRYLHENHWVPVLRATAVFSPRTTCSPQAKMSSYDAAHLSAARAS